jgi:hypothetical protein
MAKNKGGSQKQKIIGAAAGVAAAATAIGVAAAKRRGKTTTYHVKPADDGWTLEAEGAKKPESTHTTKRGAVRAGRKLAGDKAPSHLVIHRVDGSVQRQHGYGLDD